VKISKNIQLDFLIDKLTNSIQNTISGDSFATEVLRMTKTDLKQVTKKMESDHVYMHLLENHLST